MGQAGLLILSHKCFLEVIIIISYKNYRQSTKLKIGSSFCEKNTTVFKYQCLLPMLVVPLAGYRCSVLDAVGNYGCLFNQKAVRRRCNIIRTFPTTRHWTVLWWWYCLGMVRLYNYLQYTWLMSTPVWNTTTDNMCPNSTNLD